MKCFPSKEDGLLPAISNPFDFALWTQWHRNVELEVHPVVAPSESSTTVIKRHLGVGAKRLMG